MYPKQMFQECHMDAIKVTKVTTSFCSSSKLIDSRKTVNDTIIEVDTTDDMITDIDIPPITQDFDDTGLEKINHLTNETNSVTQKVVSYSQNIKLCQEICGRVDTLS